jgi:hypothetical protein
MTASSHNAAAVAAVIRRALTQDEDTPSEERLSFRVLAEAALPLLEQMAREEDLS